MRDSLIPSSHLDDIGSLRRNVNKIYGVVFGDSKKGIEKYDEEKNVAGNILRSINPEFVAVGYKMKV